MNLDPTSNQAAALIKLRFENAPDVLSELKGFIDRHLGPDRQLTLRLAS